MTRCSRSLVTEANASQNYISISCIPTTLGIKAGLFSQKEINCGMPLLKVYDNTVLWKNNLESRGLSAMRSGVYPEDRETITQPILL